MAAHHAAVPFLLRLRCADEPFLAVQLGWFLSGTVELDSRLMAFT